MPVGHTTCRARQFDRVVFKHGRRRIGWWQRYGLFVAGCRSGPLRLTPPDRLGGFDLRPGRALVQLKNHRARSPARTVCRDRRQAETRADVKQIIAIVRPFVAEKVLDGLGYAPLEACLVHEVKGFGRQKSYLDAYRGSEYSLAFLPKVQITIWVEDQRAEEVVQTIVGNARTGRMGDGKVFVLSAAHAPEQVIDLQEPAREKPAPEG